MNGLNIPRDEGKKIIHKAKDFFFLSIYLQRKTIRKMKRLIGFDKVISRFTVKLVDFPNKRHVRELLSDIFLLEMLVNL